MKILRRYLLFCFCFMCGETEWWYSKQQEHAKRIILYNNSDCMAWCRYCTKLICTVVNLDWVNPLSLLHLCGWQELSVIGTDIGSYWLKEIFSLHVCLTGCNMINFGCCIQQMSGRSLSTSGQMWGGHQKPGGGRWGFRERLTAC